MKQHLGHVTGQVIKCHKVPPNVTAEMKELLNATEKKKSYNKKEELRNLMHVEKKYSVPPMMMMMTMKTRK